MLSTTTLDLQMPISYTFYGKEFHLIPGLKHSLNEEGRKIIRRILAHP